MRLIRAFSHFPQGSTIALLLRDFTPLGHMDRPIKTLKMNSSRKIYIDDEKWIDWIDFAPSTPNPFVIDQLMQETASFWQTLEVVCVAECCGIEAFSFERKYIQIAAQQHVPLQLEGQLTNLLEKLHGLEHEVLVYHKWNQLMHKQFLAALVKHVLKVVQEELAAEI